MKTNAIINVIGETCSGKDTIVNRFLMKHPVEYSLVCSHAERPKRDYETDGVEHFFDTKEEFDKIMATHKEDDFLGYTEMMKDGKGYRYACLKEDIKEGTIPFYIVDPHGIEYMERVQKGKMNIFNIYIYSPLYDRRERYRKNRNPEFDAEKDKIFLNRIKEEKDQFIDFRNKGLYDYMIINDNHASFETLDKVFEKAVFNFVSSISTLE